MPGGFLKLALFTLLFFSTGANSSEKMTLHPTPIAFAGTQIDPEVKSAGMLPRGSALLTSSGNLAKHGIRHIIHAATGSMTKTGPKFDPTMKGVTDSIRNALNLAKNFGDHRLAIPFLGGKIFIDRIGVSPQTLADHIVETAIQYRGDLELRFVTLGNEDTQIFKNSLAKYGKSLSSTQVSLVSGSITQFSLHGASAIVNAANMEVSFGGGLSGVIANAAGNAKKIDQEAQKAIHIFNSESH